MQVEVIRTPLPGGPYDHTSPDQPPRFDQWKSTTHCHGLLFLCGETNTQLPRRGLYRRCEISSRMAFDIEAR